MRPCCVLIQDFRGRKTAIWGLGREGWSTLTALRAELPDLELAVLNDTEPGQNDTDRLRGLGNIPLYTGEEVGKRLLDFDVVIKSPGVSLYRPEIGQAREEGVFFTSSTNLWFAERADQTTVCITGTKGKSTTSSLIAHMVGNTGRQCVLAGNIGVPIISMLRGTADVWVIEMSSYQAADFNGSPSISLLLDLFPEHLDWHGSVEQYYRDKLRLLAQTSTGRCVINAADPVTQGLHPVFERTVTFNDSEGLHVADGWIVDGEERLVPREAIRLPGDHNLSNICAALPVVRLLGLPIERALSALETFTPLAHRLTQVGEKNGVLYVDDSISTTPQSTIEAIKAYRGRRITVLVGGFDRGLDFGGLALFLVDHPVCAVVALPDSGKRIVEALRQAFAGRDNLMMPAIIEAGDLAEGVAEAENVTPPGGVILLSPASPSYGHFKDFEERGEAFIKASGFGKPR
jgi:UDP-N-acetylmuramoylalanine--D-glutamate ligase